MGLEALEVVSCLIGLDREGPDAGVRDHFIVAHPYDPSSSDVVRKSHKNLFLQDLRQILSMGGTDFRVQHVQFHFEEVVGSHVGGEEGVDVRLGIAGVPACSRVGALLDPNV